MVPTLSTLRSYSLSNGIAFARLIFIITLLPFTSQQILSEHLTVLYSTGPCLMLKYFSIQRGESFFPQPTGLEVPLKFAGKTCRQNDPGWITSIDYFVDSMTGGLHLVWGDSDTSSLWTGRLNSSNYFISDIKNLRDNSSEIGSRIRSLIVDQAHKKLFASLPSLRRVERFDLIDDILSNNNEIVKFNRSVILDKVNIGKVLYNSGLDKLFWIESNKCLWSGSPSSEQKMRLMCASNSDELIYSFFIDSDSYEIYVFYEKGKIERLSGSNNLERKVIIQNCLAGEKYNDAKFYTIQMIKHQNMIRFYASDTQHYAFRQIALIKQSESGQHSGGDIDEYILDVQNSGILFTDQPNIYDFVFLGDKFDKRPKIVSNPSVTERFGFKGQVAFIENKSGHVSNQMPSTTILKIASSLGFDASIINMKLDSIKTEVLPSFESYTESENTSANNNNLPAKLEVTSFSKLPSSVIYEPITSSTYFLLWIYVLVALGILITASWIVTTLIGLRRNYQKVLSDDSSLKENLTCVKY